jgi:magnesium transporter
LASLIFGVATLFANIQLGMVVSLSLFTVILFAAIFGTLFPLLLHKYKIDPALAIGPFVTTLNDIIGLFIYFTIGTLLFQL